MLALRRRCRLPWLGELVREVGQSFDHLDVTVPCCCAVVTLDSLRYEEPIGFAWFEVSVMNPTRANYELDAEELARVADLLGHSVPQILAHYSVAHAIGATSLSLYCLAAA